MIISGLASYPFVTNPRKDDKGNPEAYTLDLIIDKKTALELKEKGLNIKKVEKDIPGIKDAKGKLKLSLRRKVKLSNGTELEPPVVVDAAKKPFSGLIGNGSKLNVVFNPREWTFMGKSGVAADLYKVQVVELVEYKSDSSPKLEDFDTVGEPITESLSSDDDIDDFL